MQATRETRRRTESITIAIGLALLGLLVVLALLGDVPGRGNANDVTIEMPVGAAIDQDRADSIARLRAEDEAVRPAFTGDRQEQIERLRRD